MRAFAPSMALGRSGSAMMLSPRVIPGRYFTFSCFSLMISVNLRPSNCFHWARFASISVSPRTLHTPGHAREKASTHLLLEAPHVNFGLEAVAALLDVLADEVCNGRSPVATACETAVQHNVCQSSG